MPFSSLQLMLTRDDALTETAGFYGQNPYITCKINLEICRYKATSSVYMASSSQGHHLFRGGQHEKVPEASSKWGEMENQISLLTPKMNKFENC